MAFLTLADVGRRLEPGGGKIADMAELLSQTNAINDDMPWVQGNLPTGHMTTLRTAIVQGTFRRFYQGSPYTKTSGAQVTFACAMLDDYSQIDKKLANITDVAELREQEDIGHMEGMSQQVAGAMIYGNSIANPAQFTGLAPYFSTVNPANAQNATNVYDGGGTASANTSMWLIGWGESTIFGIFPHGSKAGLTFEDKGDVVPGFDANSNRFEAYTSYFSWDVGLCVRDWRYTVRCANLDTTTNAGGLASTTPPDLFVLLSKMVVALPTAGSKVSNITKSDAKDNIAPALKLRLYVNRTVRAYMDIQAIRNKQTLLTPREYAGMPVEDFRGVIVGVVDQILNSEARVV
jgi:hypothetical protein